MEETNKNLPRKTYEVPKTNNKTRTYSDFSLTTEFAILSILNLFVH